MAKTSFGFIPYGDVPLRLIDVMVYTNANRWESMSSTHAPNTGMSRLKIFNPDFDAGSEIKCWVELDIDPILVNDNKYASDGASLLFNINGSNLHINIHKNGGMECTGVYGSDPRTVNWAVKLGSVGMISQITCGGRHLVPSVER
ncbi:hypothetical protein NUH87_28710 [Pseudomonas batumici]|uniref:hypothetical protein n=1 Tax=Pseudomonas batumici TaxID=226910 RepID=UPI0030CC9E61